MDEPDLAPPSLPLAADFPAPSRQQWRELVTAVLAKSRTPIADENVPEAALAYAGYDGFDVGPLYTAADLPSGAAAGRPGRVPFTRGSRAGAPGWDVRQQHCDPDPVAANQAILTDLDNGVSSLWLLLGPGGLAVEDLPRALDGVYLDLVAVALDAGPESAAAAEAYLQLVAALPPDEVTGSLGADPIGLAARTGQPADLDVAVRLAERAAAYPNLRAITVDATAYHDAGGSDGDELALSLSAGVAYLRALTDAGQQLGAAFGALEFRYAVTANQFDSIAKLRAGRLLWDRVGELCGLGADRAGQRQHAVTSAAMMSRRDPWVNILRTSIGCFAAAVAGAEAITVAPFDSAIGLPDAFGRRIARNTHSVLHDESSLARVADPAGGSFYVEAVTEQLAAAAWQKFTGIEGDGGIVAALQSGAVAELLDASWQRRRDNLVHRREPLTGVSEFAMLAEKPLQRAPLPPGRPTGGLPQHRYAEPFEALRDRSDALLADTGSRPKLFLAGLGEGANHSARAGFARNLAEVGGVETVLGTGDPGELAEAFAASGASVACLCSTDKVYADAAKPAAAALRAAGAKVIWIAGKAELAEGDIDQAIGLGCDAPARLQELYSASDSHAGASEEVGA